MAIDGMGNLVVLNETHMKVYCRNGDLLWVVRHNVSRGSEGSTKFCSAVVDGAGNVVAVDERNRRIVVLSAGGELVRFFGQHGEGKLEDPTDVAVDGAGSVFVADWGSDRVVVFSAAGGFLRAFGEQGEGKLEDPMRVAVDGEGNICVADWANRPRIVVFSAAGEFVRVWHHDYASQMWTMDMAVDGAGNFYFVDGDNHEIAVHSAAGELIGKMGGRQRKVGEISSPIRLEVDAAGSRLSAGTLQMRRKLREGGYDPSPKKIFGCQIPYPDRLVVDSAGSVFVRHSDWPYRCQHVTFFEQPVRLNDENARERTVALMMGSHHRLGKSSKLGLLDPQLLRTISDTLSHNKDTFNESAYRVRIV